MSASIPIFIDSGAFSAFTRNVVIDLGEYIAFLRDILLKMPTVVCANLDIIPKSGGRDTGKESYQNWKRMRAEGLDPVPVYHVNSDPCWLERYLDQTDYIGLGAMARIPGRKRLSILDRLWTKYLVNSDGMPRVRVHGMAMTSFGLLRRYPWYSVDSTSWLKASSFGGVCVPVRTGGKWDYNRPPVKIYVSDKSGMLGSRTEHFCNLPPNQRAVLEAYMAEVGVPMGVSTDELESVENGVSNDYWFRCKVNALFYVRTFQSLPWPRPFTIRRTEGMLDMPHPRWDGPSLKGRATMYLGGEMPIENFLRGRFESDPIRAGIMLTYFLLRNGDNLRGCQRLHALEKGRVYEAPTRDFPG